MDKRLEDLSDKVRQGESIDLSEALEVMEYQSREKSWLTKIKEWVRFNL